VDSKEQNREVEYRSKMALLGGYIDWKTTPISETETARATDPVRLARDRWWVEAEPRPLNEFRRTGQSFLDNLKKFAGRDDKAAEQRSIHHLKDRAAKGKKRAARDEGSFEEYLPEPGDNIHDWLKDLAVELDMNNPPERRPWFAALVSYVGKFTPETKSDELDQNVLGSLVRMICSEKAAAA
jgi:hypothetical protein